MARVSWLSRLMRAPQPVVLPVGYDSSYDTAGMPRLLDRVTKKIALREFRAAEVLAAELAQQIERVRTFIKDKEGRDGPPVTS